MILVVLCLKILSISFSLEPDGRWQICTWLIFLCQSVETGGKQIKALCTVKLTVCVCVLIWCEAWLALQSARSAVFIIDLSTFHNLLVEVGPHWLQHCMLCLNLALSLAGLCVSDCDTWTRSCCIFTFRGMLTDFFSCLQHLVFWQKIAVNSQKETDLKKKFLS